MFLNGRCRRSDTYQDALAAAKHGLHGLHNFVDFWINFLIIKYLTIKYVNSCKP